MSRNAAKSTHANWSSWQFTAVLLEFVHYSLVGVVNHRALHLQFGAPKILAHHIRVLFPQVGCFHHLVEVQCSEEGVELSRRLRRSWF